MRERRKSGETVKSAIAAWKLFRACKRKVPLKFCATTRRPTTILKESYSAGQGGGQNQPRRGRGEVNDNPRFSLTRIARLDIFSVRGGTRGKPTGGKEWEEGKS